MKVLMGRWARYYKTGTGEDAFYLPVTYHKRVGKRSGPLTPSPKLLRKVLKP